LGLAALIAAYREADEGEGSLRATLPLAGRMLIERQVRVAASAGANPIVVLVERVPHDLLACLDRLRRGGLHIEVARSASEAADAVHPDDRLLIVADGLLATEAQVRRILGAGCPVLLTLPGHGGDERFERIDAHSRWAGLAVVDGAMLKSTAGMLQDWDVQSTLLRRAVQAGARQFAVAGEAPDRELILAARTADLKAVEARIMEGAQLGADDWVSRYLAAPVERLAIRYLVQSSATTELIDVVAAALTAIAAVLLATGWLGTGLAALIVATLLDGTSLRLSAVRMEGPARSWAASALPAFAAAALIAFGYALSARGGWGCLVLAAAALAFLGAQRIEESGRTLRSRVFRAGWKTMSWALIPFAVTGLWTLGLGLIAGYAAGSFFWTQRQIHSAAAADGQD
jgi:hypothetical protein